MSDQKKYLGNKRQKIFSIEKNYSKRTPKILPKQKINLSPISQLFSTKKKSVSQSFKNNSNLNESQEKLSNENQRHSLIGISNLVFEYLKHIESTTGNEVTEHVKNVLQPKKNDQSNQKNIQRRVYDAINVMCAAGLIRKNKQEIQFLKKLNKEKNNIINNNNINKNENKHFSIEIKEEKKYTDEKVKEKLEELEEERKELIEAYLTLKFYEKYTKLNEKYPQRKSQKKLDFPIDLIKYNNSFPIKITSKEDLTRYLIVSNSGFIHMKPYDTIKELMSSEILAKLNESNNNDINSNQNKSNSKKATNDESLLDDINLNNNINMNNSFNLIEEEKKFEEDPKKIKILNDSFTNDDIKDIEEKAFNYLKNKKIFRDELTSNNSSLYGIVNNENPNERKEEIDNNIKDIEKENENAFIEHRFRKNSNISEVSNLYDDNESRVNKRDYNIPEIGLFNIN